MTFFWWLVIIVAALGLLWYAFGRAPAPVGGEANGRDGAAPGAGREPRDVEFGDIGVLPGPDAEFMRNQHGEPPENLPPPVHAADNQDRDPHALAGAPEEGLARAPEAGGGGPDGPDTLGRTGAAGRPDFGGALPGGPPDAPGAGPAQWGAAPLGDPGAGSGAELHEAGRSATDGMAAGRAADAATDASPDATGRSLEAGRAAEKAGERHFAGAQPDTGHGQPVQYAAWPNRGVAGPAEAEPGASEHGGPNRTFADATEAERQYRGDDPGAHAPVPGPRAEWPAGGKSIYNHEQERESQERADRSDGRFGATPPPARE